jgi:hypothetical protein
MLSEKNVYPILGSNDPTWIQNGLKFEKKCVIATKVFEYEASNFRKSAV